ncbi:amino acid ABC transporter substrate-binding protein/permease [Peribacillus psychrosaccharolyticus]|uniref:Amino acid ABC transporter substrate-binding protein/permease n=1 Tax=Peribacillus psychrosaccharolyticus TaxID=1407 RepID=A0A974RZ20_PERPY|nr:amino acid ABC transporter substrate-binding protein/permease [Peribacillus psychrosaccharolyticus]MEC2055205.1 amino acid ABC transporter substrate-binding protein/permease [Peribacillus psychrosaccharolyticus]MED3745195.1 amino acid ABC transporter substrate-binding protein/permease [Peribacillus psychrosaccharolyticus]QQS98917.1 amino acid ABC transporter substrate-binding protein/permease [Peribacillus psychrosaccharolyticus]
MRKFRQPLMIALMTLLLSFIAPFAQAATTDEKTYQIATDITFAPFEFQETNGEYVGIDIDLLNAIAEDQGFKVEIKPLGFNAAVQALESKQVDGVIAGMSITDERKNKFDFSDPYFDSGVVMAVKEGNDEIKEYKDLKGKKVAVKTGTEGASFATSIKDKYGFKIVTFDDSANMYDDVKTGNSTAVFDDYPVLAYGANQGNGLELVTEKESGGSYGFAVSKGQNPELIQQFNEGLSNLKESGEYDKILDTYLSAPKSDEDKGVIGLIKSSYPSLLKGLGMTLMLTVVSLIIASILGIVFGLCRVAKNKALNMLGSIYVDIFRGTPLIVQAFFFYFGVPAALDFRISAITAGLLTLSLNAGAYMAEIVRGGIESVDKGQMEAARSLGLPYKKAMAKVVLPQAITLMIPSFINQFIITLKDTSILSIIGINELTQSGKIIIARNLESFNMWLIVGLMYFIIIMILTKVSQRLERRIQNGKA